MAGSFSVRGPAILEESHEGPFTIILKGAPGPTEKVTVHAPGNLRLVNGANTARTLHRNIVDGGNTIVYAKAGNKPVASDSVKYAYTSTIAVLLERRGDSAVVALCIRRSAGSVLLATIASSNRLWKTLTASAVVVAIAGLLALVVADDTAIKIVGGVIAILIALVFTAWFGISTMRRGSRVRSVVAQNISSEGGLTNA